MTDTPVLSEVLFNERNISSVQPNSAYVYVIQAGNHGPVKIGWARNPFARLLLLQTGNAARLRLVHTEDFLDRRVACSLESELHRMFADLKIRGEWFRFEGALQEALIDCSYGASLVDFSETAMRMGWHMHEAGDLVG